ncbi:hypothetical protein [Aquimarina algiphila]|uniref:hypothetical protein n=1 Tax=Aquimarina algiphila TaxID=2047982 RepID=UPI002491301C|nr:hypothetical protein [Aquimarina algiphila]
MNSICKAGAFLLISLCIGCSSDDDNQDSELNNPVEIDLTEANLNDFKFTEVEYTNIEIRQPEIVDGKEKTSGEIIVTVPATSNNLSFSLASVDFDESKFEISPAAGLVQSYSLGSSITYTITSLQDPEKSIHYLVSVIKEDAPIEDQLKITGFKFEKSKNPDLPSDIETKKIIEYPGSTSGNAIFILVPIGTDLTDLVPTVDFEGEELQHKQGDGDFITYPEADLRINFTSDYDIGRFEDRNEFRLLVKNSESQKIYRVIVDVENPIELRQGSILTTNLEQDRGIIRFDTSAEVFDYRNRGNHPIEINLQASDYIDNTADGIGNIYTAFLGVRDPLQGSRIMPGEQGKMNISVNTDGAAIGDYDVDIIFSPKYDVNRARINDIIDDLNPIEDIFNTVVFNIKTTIVPR